MRRIRIRSRIWIRNPVYGSRDADPYQNVTDTVLPKTIVLSVPSVLDPICNGISADSDPAVYLNADLNYLNSKTYLY